jgi:transposase
MSDLLCHTAVVKQDEIGWQNFVKGKISWSWVTLQLQHYQEQHSKQTVDKWTSGLVTQLLELTHGMWIHRNRVLHAVDEQGLALQQAVELEAAIHEEFRKGTNGLIQKDNHFIR